MPTLLDLLGLPDSCLSFGHSLLRGEDYHISYSGTTYRLERQGRTLLYDGQTFTPSDAPAEDKRFLQALLQQYNNRLIDNRLQP